MKLTQRQEEVIRQLQARLNSSKLFDYTIEVRNNKYCLINKNMIIAQDKDHERMWRVFTMYLKSMTNA